MRFTVMNESGADRVELLDWVLWVCTCSHTERRVSIYWCRTHDGLWSYCGCPKEFDSDEPAVRLLRLGDAMERVVRYLAD